MGLLDGTIQSLISGAADFLMLDMTLTQKSSRVYTVGSGLSESSTNHAVRGFVDSTAQRFRDLALVEAGDRAIVLLQGNAPSALARISPGDLITARGIQSKVKAVDEDPAQATWTLLVSPAYPAPGAQITVQGSVVAESRVTEDGTARTTEDGTTRQTEGT